GSGPDMRAGGRRRGNGERVCTAHEAQQREVDTSLDVDRQRLLPDPYAHGTDRVVIDLVRHTPAGPSLGQPGIEPHRPVGAVRPDVESARAGERRRVRRGTEST